MCVQSDAESLPHLALCSPTPKALQLQGFELYRRKQRTCLEGRLRVSVRRFRDRTACGSQATVCFVTSAPPTAGPAKDRSDSQLTYHSMHSTQHLFLHIDAVSATVRIVRSSASFFKIK